jgi:hypothetical protein
MNPAVIDAIGLCAPVLFLFAYAMISLGKWQAESLRFQLMNFFGAVALLISLTKDFNLPGVILESCWGLISIYGIIKALRKRA